MRRGRGLRIVVGFGVAIQLAVGALAGCSHDYDSSASAQSDAALADATTSRVDETSVRGTPETGSAVRCTIPRPETGPVVGRGGAGDPPCNGDFGSDASAACPSTPGFCSTEGVCTTCGSCAAPPGHPGGTVCTTEGTCALPCPSNGCPSGRYCSGGGCALLHPNSAQPVVQRVTPEACAALGTMCTSGSVTSNDEFACFCGKIDGLDCTKDAECATGTCASNGHCGRTVGEPCSPMLPSLGGALTGCQSGVCSFETCTCASQCADDGHCGGALSGKVCDQTRGVCVVGCRGTGGNGCAYTESCTSTGNEIGICTSPCGPGCVAAHGSCQNGVCAISCGGGADCEETTIDCDSCTIDCSGSASCEEITIHATTSATITCTGPASCQGMTCVGPKCTTSCPVGGCEIACSPGPCIIP